MDDNAKNASSYHLDQEILDARGIDMTVEEVAGLPTTKYSERVQSLHLTEQDLAYLKGLRRRIKNRLASQNSRRRSMEHLRRLTRELRAVRACRDDALTERKGLVFQRDELRDRCHRLRQYVAQVLRDRLDNTEVPKLDIVKLESQTITAKDKVMDSVIKNVNSVIDNIDRNDVEKDIFECRIDKLVHKSVNHIYNKKTVFAKTVFIDNERESLFDSGVKSLIKDMGQMEDGVLNLSVKSEGRRKSHGRKQSAPRRIAYVDFNDCVLDLKIKKEEE
ncbi:hypothetical protein ACJJTC_001696 [Scirpophaga incertulas]